MFHENLSARIKCSPQPEAAARSAVTRVFDALWRPSKDASRSANSGGERFRPGEVNHPSAALFPSVMIEIIRIKGIAGVEAKDHAPVSGYPASCYDGI